MTIAGTRSGNALAILHLQEMFAEHLKPGGSAAARMARERAERAERGERLEPAEPKPLPNQKLAPKSACDRAAGTSKMNKDNKLQKGKEKPEWEKVLQLFVGSEQLVVRAMLSIDFTLTHFYISGPGPRCTEPIRSGLVWVCSDLPKDLEITDVYDDLRPDELESHQPMDEDRPILRFQTDVESREAEVELQRWQEGRYVIVRFLDTHFAEEQVNVDVGMIGLVGHFGRCGRHQGIAGLTDDVSFDVPIALAFSAARRGVGPCPPVAADVLFGRLGRFLEHDFHQTTMYNSRFHCSVTGFDLCEDTSLGKVTDASVQVTFTGGKHLNVLAWQSCLDHLTQSGRARAILEEEALLQLVSDLVHSILVGVRPGCDIQVNDLVGVSNSSHKEAVKNPSARSLTFMVRHVNPSSACPNLEEDDDMDASGVASASFLVSSRDWKGKRQAENLWKVTKQLNDEDAAWQQTTARPSVVITTAGLLTEVRRGVHCDVNEAAASSMCL
ncbi:hypothetical protein AK812_SmicGene20065 [Symbiodinium microadriaticum]|uniref:Uncharacterized protein n=1 Tax=Symbiodinium microadriaticum TaxID=2951 RepID=A0A1Q9DQY9_SYMMI|nr:hypothetical protein AK812_SmicGene20065 [Symbiodinium microadriaticum]